MQISMQSDEVVLVMAELIQALVDQPESVEVQALRGTQASVIDVRTAQRDHGKIIGRGGRTIQAIRTLLVGISGAQNRHLVLEMIEPDEKQVPVVERNRFRVNLASGRFEDDPVRATQALLTRLIRLLVDDRNAVAVSIVKGRQVVVFEVSADQADINKVVGIGGSRADAVRVVLLNLGTRVGLRFLLEILEPVERGQR